MLDPGFPAAIGRGPYVPGDPSLNLSGTVGPGTLGRTSDAGEVTSGGSA
jgi:hypothetical protein